MGLKNRKRDMTPIDLARKPVRQKWPVTWLMRGGCAYMTRGMKITKKNMDGLTGPFLVFATHQGFSDYYILPRVLLPHWAIYVSDMEGFAAFGDYVYRAIGCIGKRRYVPEWNVVRNIRYALFEMNMPVVIFPESRHCDAGITSNIPGNLGKMAKMMGVPVVTVTNHGSYLANPFWDEAHSRKVRLESEAELLFTAEQVKSLDAGEIQRKIEEKLTYNEYEWQWENRISIPDSKRAEGIHKPLYRCIKCGTEGKMESADSHLRCRACGASWQMDEFGRLEAEDKSFVMVPDWYRRERQEVAREIAEGTYEGIDIPVEVEALPNAKGFVPLGTGRLVSDGDRTVLSLEREDTGLRDSFPLVYEHKNMESMQTEYNYRKKGPCIVLSTKDCCYYVYSKDPQFLVTRLEFAAEERRKLAENNKK